MNPQKPTSSTPKKGLYPSRKTTWVLGISALCTFSALSIKAASHNNKLALDPPEVIEYEYGSTNNKTPNNYGVITRPNDDETKEDQANSLELLDKGYKGGNEYPSEMKQEEQIDKDKKIAELTSLTKRLKNDLAARDSSLRAMEQHYREYVLNIDPDKFSELTAEKQRELWLKAVMRADLNFLKMTLPKAKDKRSLLDMACNEDKQTVLHLAVENGDLSLLKFLVDGKSTEALSDYLNKKDVHGHTPMGLAKALENKPMIIFMEEKLKHSNQQGSRLNPLNWFKG